MAKELTTGQAHGVKGGPCHLVVGQVVDGVPPEGETGAPLGQHEGHSGRTAGLGGALVMQQHWDAREDQAPLVLTHVLVQVGQRGTDKDLRGKQKALEEGF